MGEFQPEVTDARAPPGFQVPAGLLRFGAEDGVAAADVGHHRMGAAGGSRSATRVLFARTAAIAIAGSGREEAAEDAVLGVEDGQVLVGDDLNACRRRVAGEFRNLSGVQVVGGREPR